MGNLLGGSFNPQTKPLPPPILQLQVIRWSYIRWSNIAVYILKMFLLMHSYLKKKSILIPKKYLKLLQPLSTVYIIENSFSHHNFKCRCRCCLQEIEVNIFVFVFYIIYYTHTYWSGQVVNVLKTITYIRIPYNNIIAISYAQIMFPLNILSIKNGNATLRYATLRILTGNLTFTCRQ